MFRVGLVVLCFTVAGCATTEEQRAAQAQECVGEVEESTGSRVETNKVCKPAPGQ